MTITINGSAFVDGSSLVPASFLNWVRTGLPTCIDQAGGTHALTAPLVLTSQLVTVDDLTVADDLIVTDDATVGGETTLSGGLALGGIISPAALGATQDNWAPTGLAGATIIRVTADAGGTSLTGISAIDNKVLFIVNIGAGVLTLADSTTSTAANQFALSGNIALDQDEGVTLWYDSTSDRWRCVGRNT